MSDQIKEDLADEGVASGVEHEEENYKNQDPFDPDSISLSSRIVALDAVLRRIKNKTIILNPDFQREQVWDVQRKSLLIESMMLRIPLPMFYVSEDKDGIWEVVDGLQRLTTIRDFILGADNDGKGFKLKGLEFWGGLFNEKDYYEIEAKSKMPRIINNIMEAQLSFTIINPDTPEKVKRNIFKRINTGGMRLSPQEIRHALYQGEATVLLKKLVSTVEYKKVMGGAVKDNRMAGRELLLRYLSFHLRGWRSYKGDMDTFLADTMRYLNKEIELDDAKEYPVEKIIADANMALERAYTIFGDHTFRRSRRKQRKTPVNKSLFDVWMYCFSRMSNGMYQEILNSKEEFLDEYYKILDDDEFIDSISRYGGDVFGVKFRYTNLIDLVKRYEV